MNFSYYQKLLTLLFMSLGVVFCTKEKKEVITLNPGGFRGFIRYFLFGVLAPMLGFFRMKIFVMSREPIEFVFFFCNFIFQIPIFAEFGLLSVIAAILVFLCTFYDIYGFFRGPKILEDENERLATSLVWFFVNSCFLLITTVYIYGLGSQNYLIRRRPTKFFIVLKTLTSLYDTIRGFSLNSIVNNFSDEITHVLLCGLLYSVTMLDGFAFFCSWIVSIYCFVTYAALQFSAIYAIDREDFYRGFLGLCSSVSTREFFSFYMYKIRHPRLLIEEPDSDLLLGNWLGVEVLLAIVPIALFIFNYSKETYSSDVGFSAKTFTTKNTV